MTPEQMRVRADALEGVDLALPTKTSVHVIGAREALRAAADQLEAVLNLHFRDEQPFDPTADSKCQECGQFWPCETHIAITTETAP